MNERCVLNNGFLQVEILPEEGGRVQSLRSCASGVEFLMQSKEPRTHWTASMDAEFRNGSAAGIEECLPSVALSPASTEGGPVPDHGDFWQLAWQLEQGATPQDAAVSAEGFSRPLRFCKEFSLRQQTLSIRYTVRNTSQAPVSFLYACHPLLAVDMGDRIALPSSIRSLNLHSSRKQRLGVSHSTVGWPRHMGHDLSYVQSEERCIAEMLYSDRLSEGFCGLYRTASKQGIVMRFDPKTLPYLGLWLCYGGWPDSTSGSKQYAVAPEPTFAPYGSLLEAQQHNAAYVLAPDTSCNWSIHFEVTQEGMDFETFVSHCNSEGKD